MPETPRTWTLRQINRSLSIEVVKDDAPVVAGERRVEVIEKAPVLDLLERLREVLEVKEGS